MYVKFYYTGATKHLRGEVLEYDLPQMLCRHLAANV